MKSLERKTGGPDGPPVYTIELKYSLDLRIGYADYKCRK